MCTATSAVYYTYACMCVYVRVCMCVCVCVCVYTACVYNTQHHTLLRNVVLRNGATSLVVT